MVLQPEAQNSKGSRDFEAKLREVSDRLKSTRMNVRWFAETISIVVSVIYTQIGSEHTDNQQQK